MVGRCERSGLGVAGRWVGMGRRASIGVGGWAEIGGNGAAGVAGWDDGASDGLSLLVHAIDATMLDCGVHEMKYSNLALELAREPNHPGREKMRQEIDRLITHQEMPSFSRADLNFDSFSMAIYTGLELGMMVADPETDTDLFLAAKRLLHHNTWCEKVSLRASLEKTEDFIGRLHRATKDAIGSRGWAEFVMNGNTGFLFGDHDRTHDGLLRILDSTFPDVLELIRSEMASISTESIMDALWGAGMTDHLRQLRQVSAPNEIRAKWMDERIRLLEAGTADRNNDPGEFYPVIREDITLLAARRYFTLPPDDKIRVVAKAEVAAKGFKSANMIRFEKEHFAGVMFRPLEIDQKQKGHRGFSVSINALTDWLKNYPYVSPYREQMYAAPPVVANSWWFFTRRLIYDRLSGYGLIQQANQLIRSGRWPCGWEGNYPQGQYKVFRYDLA